MFQPGTNGFQVGVQDRKSVVEVLIDILPSAPSSSQSDSTQNVENNLIWNI